MARILSVSYDQALLDTRQLLLESHGYEVASALGFNEALAYCQNGRRFDLLIIGHSIPNTEKLALVAAFRAQSSAPVIALKRYGEAPVLHANFHVEPEPKELLAVIATLELGGAASA